jgi:drug efflux transport system permease protein
MAITRIIAITRKEFIQIMRDRRTLIMTLLMPIIQMILLGYAANSDVKNVPLAVLDQSRSSQSRALLDAFRATGYFVINYEVTSEPDLQRLIDEGLAKTGLIIPPDYGQKVSRGQSVSVAFIIDGTDSSISAGSLAAARLIAQTQSAGMQVQRLSRQASISSSMSSASAIDVRTQVWYNPDMITTFIMIPAMIGLILQMVTSTLSASAIVREYENGTIEQLIVTPVRSWELMVGKLLPYTLIAFADVLEILVLGTLWFGVPIRGSIGLLLTLAALFLVTSLSMGLLISTVARTQREAQTLGMIIQLPSMFLSGFFFPIAAMPQVLQWVSVLVPLKYFMVIIKAIVLKGAGLQLLRSEVLALVIFALVTMVAAVSRFRKRLD